MLLALASSDFTHHHNVLWILVAGLSVFHFAQQMTVLGLSVRRPSVYVWPKAAHSVVFLVLALPLGTRLGIQGVAIAFLVASITYLAMIFHANRRLAAWSLSSNNDRGSTGGEEDRRAVEP